MINRKSETKYNVDKKSQQIIKQYAKRLTEEYGFYVTESSALCHLIRIANDQIINEPCRG